MFEEILMDMTKSARGTNVATIIMPQINVDKLYQIICLKEYRFSASHLDRSMLALFSCGLETRLEREPGQAHFKLQCLVSLTNRYLPLDLYGPMSVMRQRQSRKTLCLRPISFMRGTVKLR